MRLGGYQIRRFRLFLATLGPVIAAHLAQSGESVIEIVLPNTEPPLTLRADPRDPGHARFLALACDMSRSAQADISAVEESASPPKLSPFLAAQLPAEAPVLSFTHHNCPPGIVAFWGVLASLCRIRLASLLMSVIGISGCVGFYLMIESNSRFNIFSFFL